LTIALNLKVAVFSGDPAALVDADTPSKVAASIIPGLVFNAAT
jgi:hypothetical protein